MTMDVHRITNLLVLLSCAALLGIALYMQYALYLDPCPLCVVQRVAIIAIGLVSLAALIHGPAGAWRTAYASAALALSAFGAAIAARHVYLQNLPEDQIPECLPGIGFILENNSFIDAASIILGGTGECAETLWTLLGISIPGWTLIAFCVCGAAQAFLLVKARRQARAPRDADGA